MVEAPPARDDLQRSDLESADPDDLAFADAVALMGPVLALSEDGHLTSRGLATDSWRDLPQLIEALKTADVTLKVTPELSAIVITEAAKAARRHPRIAATLALMAFLVAGPFGPERTRLNKDRARTIVGVILRGLIHLLETHRTSSQEIAARLAPGSAEGAVRIVVAVLARLREPIAEDSLAARVDGQVDSGLLTTTLAECPAFVETSAGWQLGRRAV
ncbi:MAG: hypothetical protein JSU06_00330 [Actinobacteria bacterium]|nr:hypothetical protein [Actinomycetota bacterium]